MAEQIAADVPALEARREICSLINYPTIGQMATGKIRVRNMIEVTEGIRIVQRAMFAEAFPIISALNAVQVAIRAEVRAVNKLALTVKVQSPGVAAALAKKFELVRQRMITPDALLKFQTANVRCDRAALAAV